MGGENVQAGAHYNIRKREEGPERLVIFAAEKAKEGLFRFFGGLALLLTLLALAKRACRLYANAPIHHLAPAKVEDDLPRSLLLSCDELRLFSHAKRARRPPDYLTEHRGLVRWRGS